MSEAGEVLWMKSAGPPRPRGPLWDRVKMAARLLRGRPVVYRAVIEPRGVMFALGEMASVQYCNFGGGTQLIAYDPDTGQAEVIDMDAWRS